jgi:hypothetical protein
MPEMLKSDVFEGQSLVYIRQLDVTEASGLLPPDALMDVDDPSDLFILTSAEGQHLAIVEGRDAAFAAALAHDLSPLSVH